MILRKFAFGVLMWNVFVRFHRWLHTALDAISSLVVLLAGLYTKYARPDALWTSLSYPTIHFVSLAGILVMTFGPQILWRGRSIQSRLCRRALHLSAGLGHHGPSLHQRLQSALPAFQVPPPGASNLRAQGLVTLRCSKAGCVVPMVMWLELQHHMLKRLWSGCRAAQEPLVSADAERGAKDSD